MLRALINTWRTRIAIFASLLVVPFMAQAAGGFSISEFDSVVVLHEDAAFTVTETITGEFLEPRHGIFRDIPVEYDAGNGTIQSIVLDVESVRMNERPIDYEMNRFGSYVELKIGDPDVTVVGPFVYEITYRVERAIIYHDLQDELYWNVTGDAWETDIPSVTATVLVDDVAKDDLAADCYVGPTGSTLQDCTMVVEKGSVRAHAADFLTVSVRFPKGAVREPGTGEVMKWWVEDNWALGLAFVMPVAVLLGLFGTWLRFGRDRKSRTVVAQYEPPEGMKPTEVGLLLDATIHPRDVAGAIVDLAVRGYLKIEEEETKTLAFKKVKYMLRKVKEPDAVLEGFERAFLIELWKDGDAVNLSTDSGKTQMVSARKVLDHEVYASMAEEKYFIRNPKEVRMLYMGIGAMFAFVAYVALSGSSGGQLLFLAFTLILSAAMFFLFAKIMPKKTEKGDLAYEHALGFKLFLETAERDRIKWQVKEGMFEKFLPYAIVFGVVDKWTKAFADVPVQQPNWYAGNFMMFNAMSFSEKVTAFGDVSGRVSVPSRSGGGGGGGFSGGGFGGGGGGSW